MSQSWPAASPSSPIAVLASDLPARDDSLRTLFSGATAPTDPVAYQLWADTTNKLLKQRDGANAAWVVLAPLAANAGRGEKSIAPGALAAATWRFSAMAAAATIVRVGIVPNATTATSAAGSKEWTFLLRNKTQASAALFSATPSTATVVSGVGGGEMTDGTVYWLTANQNANVAAGDVLELVVGKVGTPTAVSEVQVVLDFYDRGL